MMAKGQSTPNNRQAQIGGPPASTLVNNMVQNISVPNIQYKLTSTVIIVLLYQIPPEKARQF